MATDVYYGTLPSYMLPSYTWWLPMFDEGSHHVIVFVWSQYDGANIAYYPEALY